MLNSRSDVAIVDMTCLCRRIPNRFGIEMSLTIKLSWSERFLNFMTHNTKLYIYGEKSADAKRKQELYKELFLQLRPFFDKLYNEAYQQGHNDALKAAE